MGNHRLSDRGRIPNSIEYAGTPVFDDRLAGRLKSAAGTTSKVGPKPPSTIKPATIVSPS